MEEFEDKHIDLSEEEKEHIETISGHFSWFTWLSLIALFIIIMQAIIPAAKPEISYSVWDGLTITTDVDSSEIVNGIHQPTGLIADNGLGIVIRQCGSCHALDQVTQHRATRTGWLEVIRWMQKTQKLGDLGKDEPLILDYLAKNYAPQHTGRRMPLENIEWYELVQE
jgi:hypothetical protein